jgi:hypothetical protein
MPNIAGETASKLEAAPPLLLQQNAVINQVHLLDARFDQALFTKYVLKISARFIRYDNIHTFHNKLLFPISHEISIGLTHLETFLSMQVLSRSAAV